MPRRALLHEGYPAEKDDDEIAARCREWRAYQQLSNGAEVPAANQCPCGESGLSKVQKNQCALPGERARNSSAAGTPLVSGGEALFLLLLLLTVSMCVSVLLSPESRRRRRERREREAREKERALRRERKRWDRSVTKGLWLEQPDGAVCVCVFDADATTKDDGDTSRSRRGRRAAAMKLSLNQSDGDAGTQEDALEFWDVSDGGSSTESSGGESDEGESDAEGRRSLSLEAQTGGRRLGDANNV